LKPNFSVSVINRDNIYQDNSLPFSLPFRDKRFSRGTTPANKGRNKVPRDGRMDDSTNDNDEDMGNLERRSKGNISRASLWRNNQTTGPISGRTPDEHARYDSRETVKANAETSPVKRHGEKPTIVFKEMSKAQKIFVRQDAPTGILQPPYERPYEVLSRGEKTFKIKIRGRIVIISIDRLKLAYILLEDKKAFREPT